MDCRKYQLQFQLHLDGDLSPEERQLLQAHLTECLPCYRKWSSLQKTRELLRQLPDLDPPDHVRTDVMAQLKEHHQRQRPWFLADRRQWLPVGVALTALLVISVAVWQLLPSPFSWKESSSSASKSSVSHALPSDVPTAKFSASNKNQGAAAPVVILKVKDFSRANQELRSVLRSFASPQLQEKQGVRPVRSSSIWLIDIPVPDGRYRHLLQELHKIGHLDRRQLEDLGLSTPSSQQSISFRLVVVSSGTEAETRQRGKQED
ncbi:MAG: zf-HC2 domain-containing protein [Deltaproteobacteria bacterium]|nr:MAG: zf-HC2 domain-containing protein [Deltaproteobacteria bacterium]